MNKLRNARLIAGTESPAGDGITGAVRCVIEDDQGNKHTAILKTGSLQEVAAEVMASLLLSGWGLQVPRPYLVLRENELCFASADVGYPNLKKRLNWVGLPPEAQHAMELWASKLVCTFQSMPLATACDEAIDNRDRNIGNILWDGLEEVWIDHAYSLGVGNLPNVNKLCNMAIVAGVTDQIQRGAVAASLTLDRTLPNAVGNELRGTPAELPELLANVTRKLSAIGEALIARFPQPADLFGAVK